jgi:hypothetical protein
MMELERMLDGVFDAEHPLHGSLTPDQVTAVRELLEDRQRLQDKVAVLEGKLAWTQRALDYAMTRIRKTEREPWFMARQDNCRLVG